MGWGCIYQKFFVKKIDEKSKYYEAQTPHLTVFTVANKGKNHEVFIVGDSHARF